MEKKTTGTAITKSFAENGNHQPLRTKEQTNRYGR